MIDTSKLTKELEEAGIPVSGCNSNGIVWDKEGKDIQDREDVKRVMRAHDPTPEPKMIEKSLAEVVADLLRRVEKLERELKELS